MNDDLGNIVYSKNVIEFVTVAKEYCTFVEGAVHLTKADFLDTGRKILPLLYLKASMLPKLESIFEDSVEKFVSESDWFYIHNNIKTKLGQHNDYMEVFDPNIQLSEGPLAASLAEDFSDIYQDLKDLVSNFGIGNEEIMNDAIWECKLNFEEYWGQRLVNAMRAVHMSLYSGDDLSEEANRLPDQNSDDENKGQAWFLKNRQEDYLSNLED